MAPRPRERVTIDLRGIGPRLQAHASANGKTTAAVVRAAVLTLFEEDGGPEEAEQVDEKVDARTIKVTLRLGAAHAVRLGRSARRVGVSQGTYVAGLLDGQPLMARAADHGAAVAALADSTHKLAAMSSDIRAVIRLVSHGSTDEAEKYRGILTSLLQEVRAHLEVSSRLMANLTSRPMTTGSRRSSGKALRP